MKSKNNTLLILRVSRGGGSFESITLSHRNHFLELGLHIQTKEGKHSRMNVVILTGLKEK